MTEIIVLIIKVVGLILNFIADLPVISNLLAAIELMYALPLGVVGMLLKEALGLYVGYRVAKTLRRVYN